MAALEPRDWLLLLVALRGAPEGLDPVRLQKGMFLLDIEGTLPQHECYAFRPYNFGPMSAGIYADVERLERDGLIERRTVPGKTWARARATPRGLERAAELLRVARERRPQDVRALAEIKRRTAHQSLSALLRDVYEHYPEFATRSLFQR
jgi:uncharacterized protein YwgA